MRNQKSNVEVCEVVDEAEYESSVQYLNTLQTIIKEIQGISVNTSSDIKYLLERIQGLEQDIQTIKKCVTTKDTTFPSGNGLYPLSNGSNIQDRLNAMVGKQPNSAANLFSSLSGSQGGVLDHSIQRTNMNTLMSNSQNNLHQRMGKYTSLLDQQQTPRIPMKRQRPNMPLGRSQEGNQRVEDITVLSDDEIRGNKTISENEKNKMSECLPLEVGSKRASNPAIALADHSKNKTNQVNGNHSITNSASVIDTKKRTNMSRVKPAVKLNKEGVKANGTNKDDVMVVDEGEDNHMDFQNFACDVIIHSGDGNVETIPDTKVDLMLDQLIDNNGTQNTAPGKEVDLVLDELIGNNAIQDPELLADIMAQVPYAKTKTNKTNSQNTKKVTTNKTKPAKGVASRGRPRANSKTEKAKNDEPEISSVESNLEDNLKEFESEVSGNLGNELPLLPLELPLMDLPLM